MIPLAERPGSPDERIAQLRLRRAALGFTRGQMAAGIGLRLLQVHGIEKGIEADELIDFYDRWLSRMEGWSAEQRAAQLKLARYGSRFAVIATDGKEI